MIRKHLKVLIITSLIILLPMLAGIILWKQLPEQIPMHWNFAGEVDRWGSKAFAVFGMPAILLGFQWVCALGVFMDPKRANHTGKILHLIFWMIPAGGTAAGTAGVCTLTGSAGLTAFTAGADFLFIMVVKRMPPSTPDSILMARI